MFPIRFARLGGYDDGVDDDDVDVSDLVSLELLSSVIVPDGLAQLVMLTVYDGLVWASDKAL